MNDAAQVLPVAAVITRREFLRKTYLCRDSNFAKEKPENGCVQIQQGICPRVQYGEQFILVVIEISR